MANVLQLRALPTYPTSGTFNPAMMFSVGRGGGDNTGAMDIPQTPNFFDGPGGRVVRNNRVLEIVPTPSIINKSNLVNSPKSVKDQLGRLIDIGAIEVLDLSAGTPGTVLTGDQVRQL